MMLMPKMTALLLLGYSDKFVVPLDQFLFRLRNRSSGTTHLSNVIFPSFHRFVVFTETDIVPVECYMAASDNSDRALPSTSSYPPDSSHVFYI